MELLCGLCFQVLILPLITISVEGTGPFSGGGSVSGSVSAGLGQTACQGAPLPSFKLPDQAPLQAARLKLLRISGPWKVNTLAL